MLRGVNKALVLRGLTVCKCVKDRIIQSVKGLTNTPLLTLINS